MAIYSEVGELSTCVCNLIQSIRRKYLNWLFCLICRQNNGQTENSCSRNSELIDTVNSSEWHVGDACEKEWTWFINGYHGANWHHRGSVQPVVRGWRCATCWRTCQCRVHQNLRWRCWTHRHVLRTIWHHKHEHKLPKAWNRLTAFLLDHIFVPLPVTFDFQYKI